MATVFMWLKIGPRVVYNAGNFLLSAATISSVKILLPAVVFIRKFIKIIHPSDRLELLGSM